MESIVSSATRRAPAILFTASLIVFALGIAVAFMSAEFTAQQESNAILGGVSAQTGGVARIQLLSGIMTAFQNAAWPFAAGALVRALQWRSAP